MSSLLDLMNFDAATNMDLINPAITHDRRR